MNARYEVEICRSQLGLYYGLVYRIEDGERHQVGNTTGVFGGIAVRRGSVIGAATQIARAHRNKHESPDIVRLEL